MHRNVTFFRPSPSSYFPFLSHPLPLIPLDTVKGRLKAGISVSAETEITPKVTNDFRPKTETETESACRTTAMDYMSIDFSVDSSSCFSFTAWTDRQTHRRDLSLYQRLRL